MKAHGWCRCKGPHICSHGTRKVTSSMLGGLYPRKSPGTHFERGWIDPTTNLNTKEWRKNLHPTATQDRTRVVWSLVKLLSRATWSRILKHTSIPSNTATICFELHTRNVGLYNEKKKTISLWKQVKGLNPWCRRRRTRKK